MHFHFLDGRDSLPTNQLRDITELLRSVDPAEPEMTHARLADVTKTSFWLLGKMFAARGSSIVALGVLVPKEPFELARLEKILVAEGHRRQGIGIQLMHRMVDVARSRTFRQVEAGLVDEGTPLDRLYKRFHFTRNVDRYLLTME